jgi:hypothetical protein
MKEVDRANLVRAKDLALVVREDLDQGREEDSVLGDQVALDLGNKVVLAQEGLVNLVGVVKEALVVMILSEKSLSGGWTSSGLKR